LWTDERELVRAVGDYLEEGFQQDEAAVVVATPSHAYAISAELAARRLDTRRLLVMDAGQLMDTIVVDGRVSAHAADRVLRGTLELARARGDGVRIYGEISDLLCACGNSPEAFTLERLANEVLEAVPLTILCGYPIAPFAGGARESCLAEIRSLHTHVLSGSASI
jgi:hypothetical protein